MVDTNQNNLNINNDELLKNKALKEPDFSQSDSIEKVEKDTSIIDNKSINNTSVQPNDSSDVISKIVNRNTQYFDKPFSIADYSAVKKNEDVKIPVPPIQEKTQTIPLTKPTVKPIVRTYKSDVEETIQSGHVSSINIALAENKKMTNQFGVVENEDKKFKINKTMLIATILLVVGGALAIIIPNFLVKKEYAAPVATETTSTLTGQKIITANSIEEINIKDINLSRLSLTLKERIDQSATSLGQVKQIILTEDATTSLQAISASSFLNLINATLPNTLERTLKADYAFGMHNYDGNQIFLVLKIGSYEVGYAGMLSWENDMRSDLKDLFGLTSGSSVATSTDEQPNTQFSINQRRALGKEIMIFEDAQFNNKDCRVVRNSDSKIIFLYSIIDDNTIVITTNTATLKEIMTRLNSARTVTQ